MLEDARSVSGRLGMPCRLQQDLQRLLALVTRHLEALAQPMREGAAAFVGLGALEGSQPALRRMHTPHPGVWPCTGGQSNLHASLVPLSALSPGDLPCEGHGTANEGWPCCSCGCVGCALVWVHASPPVCGCWKPGWTGTYGCWSRLWQWPVYHQL